MRRVLVVDDEQDLCEILRFNLESEQFDVECVNSAEEALTLLDRDSRFDIILLDVMMENMSGYELAQRLRRAGNDIPIIFLTAKSEEADLLKAFESGGDDYITKPFSFPAVFARIKAVLRRSVRERAKDGLHHGLLYVDKDTKVVYLNDMPLQLTKKEYRILDFLMRHPGRHLSREEIMDEVWEGDVLVGERSIDVHIARLRRKLGEAGKSIVNHSGFGYLFQPELLGAGSHE